MAAWFADTEPFPDRLTIDLVKVGDLAYGENPHQRAAFYREAGARRHVLSRVDQVSGKPLSFNNLADLQAARTIASAFQLPCCAIIKHANPCGVAVGATLEEAYARALAGDRGGIRRGDRRQPAGHGRWRGGCSRRRWTCSSPPATTTPRARRSPRRPRRACSRTGSGASRPASATCAGCSAAPDPGPRQRDRGPLRHAGRDRDAPDKREWEDILFAWRIAHFVHSNAIVLVKDLATVGIGAGR